jgi:hypothetical protein
MDWKAILFVVVYTVPMVLIVALAIIMITTNQRTPASNNNYNQNNSSTISSSLDNHHVRLLHTAVTRIVYLWYTLSLLIIAVVSLITLIGTNVASDYCYPVAYSSAEATAAAATTATITVHDVLTSRSGSSTIPRGHKNSTTPYHFNPPDVTSLQIILQSISSAAVLPSDNNNLSSTLRNSTTNTNTDNDDNRTSTSVATTMSSNATSFGTLTDVWPSRSTTDDSNETIIHHPTSTADSTTDADDVFYDDHRHPGIDTIQYQLSFFYITQCANDTTTGNNPFQLVGKEYIPK